MTLALSPLLWILGLGRGFRPWKLLRNLAAALAAVYLAATGFHWYKTGLVGHSLAMTLDDGRAWLHCPTKADNIWYYVQRSKEEEIGIKIGERLAPFLAPVVDIPQLVCNGEYKKATLQERRSRSRSAVSSPLPPTSVPAPTPTSGTQPTWLVNPAALESAVNEKVNAYRTSKGIGRLQWDATIARIARQHSTWMGTTGLLDHDEPNGRTVDARFDGTRFSCGENILMRPRATLITRVGGVIVRRENDIFSMNTEQLSSLLVQQWITSPGHEENIRTRHYTLGAVGIFYSRSREELYATHNMCFAK